MPDILDIFLISGDMCIRRTTPGISMIKEKIEITIQQNKKIIFDWSRVKVMTVSFIDEIMPELIIKYGKEILEKNIEFRPELTGFLKDQLDNGVNNRVNT
jgi:hypothetical protein